MSIGFGNAYDACRVALGVQRTDYIERMIQQLAHAIAHALGFAQAGDVERAKEDLRATWSSFVGVRREDLFNQMMNGGH